LTDSLVVCDNSVAEKTPFTSHALPYYLVIYC